MLGMREKVNGVEIEFDEKGSGAAVLLIHGFPFNRSIWTRQFDTLSKSFRVIAPDLRGFGKSAVPQGPLAMEDYANDILALMDRLNIIRFVPIGHSMGGYVLFAIHRLARERMSGAVFVCSRAAADTPEVKKTREENADKVLKDGMRVLADSMPDKVLGPDARPPTREEVKKIILSGNPLGAAAALRAMARRPDGRPQLSHFTFPTLIVAGKGDKIVPPAESEAIAKAVSGARLAMFEGAGHMPMIEKPETLAKTLQEFLRRV